MQPIGPLMQEHRLIEKMIALMNLQYEKFMQEKKADVNFIATALDFIRTYADKCHHRKEEDILFRDLKKKNLSSWHKNTLQELIDEHNQARNSVSSLAKSKDKYAAGNHESFREILNSIKVLTELYPKHIEKEEKHFFVHVMQYFDDEEQQKMLQEFWEADRSMIHLKYKNVIDELKAITGQSKDS